MMSGSFLWGTLAASSLVIGAVLALAFHIKVRVIGLIMGFGTGVLISAVAFDLVQEASDTASENGPVFIGLFVGCAVFALGNWLLSRHGASGRKGPTGSDSDGSALPIVLGTVLDGIPRVDGDRIDDLRRRVGWHRLPDRRVRFQLARIDLINIGPRHGWMEKVEDPACPQAPTPGRH